MFFVSSAPSGSILRKEAYRPGSALVRTALGPWVPTWTSGYMRNGWQGRRENTLQWWETAWRDSLSNPERELGQGQCQSSFNFHRILSPKVHLRRQQEMVWLGMHCIGYSFKVFLPRRVHLQYDSEKQAINHKGAYCLFPLYGLDVKIFCSYSSVNH